MPSPSGPERVSATVQRAMGMGADHGIHILDRTDAYRSPFTVASLIAACVHQRNYDLIMTGVMAEDTMASQTGQIIAALLDLPCASSVIKEEIRPKRAEIAVERETEGGNRETVRAQDARGTHHPARDQFSQVPVLFQGDAGTDLCSGAHQGRGSRYRKTERILSWGADSRIRSPKGCSSKGLLGRRRRSSSNILHEKSLLT